MIRRAVPPAGARAEEAVRRITLAALLALTVLLVAATPAVADDTRCVGVFSGVADNIIVPSGAECVLEGAQVSGNVLAEPESMLFIGPGTNIRGSVEAKQGAHTGSFQAVIGGSYKCDNCFFEDVVESSVGGNVDITGADDGDFIIDSQIAGNVHIEESSAGAFAFVVEGTTIGGDLKFEKNSGPTDISRNTIHGDLQIFENNVEGAFCPPPPPPGEEPPLCPVLENGHFNANRVDGDMQIFKNRGPSEVVDNMIRENLQCFENSPPPASAGNTAREKQGQCLA
jgi:hypothetical protein